MQPQLESGKGRRGEAAQNVEAVRRCRRRQEVGNCIGTSARPLQELYRPFGDARFQNMSVRTGLRLGDVFDLAYQCERRLGARGLREKSRASTYVANA